MGYLTMLAWILIMYFFTHRVNNMNIISHKNDKKWFKNKGKVQFLAFLYSSWIALLNLILIVISLPGIVNPGPGLFNHQSSNLSVLYFNASGLFNPLNLKTFTNKNASFQSYVFENKPSKTHSKIIVCFVKFTFCSRVIQLLWGQIALGTLGAPWELGEPLDGKGTHFRWEIAARGSAARDSGDLGTSKSHIFHIKCIWFT